MKVFNLGLSRVGLNSWTAAMERLGYSAKRNPRDPLQAAKQYDALSDVMVVWERHALRSAYPEAKWIIGTRQRDEWVESAYHYFNHELRRFAPWSQQAHIDVFGALRPDRDCLYSTYDWFHDVEYLEFVDRLPSDRWMMMDICGGDGWEKLCGFLGKPVPDEPFPHRHKRRARK